MEYNAIEFVANDDYDSRDYYGDDDRLGWRAVKAKRANEYRINARNTKRALNVARYSINSNDIDWDEFE